MGATGLAILALMATLPLEAGAIAASPGDDGYLLRHPAAAGIFGRPASAGWVSLPR